MRMQMINESRCLPIKIDKEMTVWATVESSTSFPIKQLLYEKNFENYFKLTNFRFKFIDEIEDNLVEVRY